MKKRIDNLSKHVLVIIFFVILVGYSIFQARFLILGPRISIISPLDGAITDSEIIILEAKIKNASWITLNGRQVFTDEKGNLEEKLILSEGLSIMTLKARDRFGREREEEIRVYMK